jgi:threonine dehydratase
VGPTLEDVRRAQERIAAFAHRTPVLTSRHFDARTGARLCFKCENFQRAGAFKYRGATNAVRSLRSAEAAKGVLTHSSGNHAQALALAARERKVACWVVMPKGAPEVKRAAVRGYGATIVECEPTLKAREETAAQVAAETGAVFVHPYDDERVVAGAGTAALELLDHAPEPLDVLVVPVGGGGLASGTCVAAHGYDPKIRVFGAEPTGADDAWRSLKEGRIQPSLEPRTVADGLRTALSDLTFGILKEHLEEIVRVPDENTIAAMRQVFERMKIVIEPSSAVALGAALLLGERLRGKRVGVVLSGGNVDLDRLPWLPAA